MKFTCRHCRDTFDIPDGKGITRAVCPFCDKPNDLREPPPTASEAPLRSNANPAGQTVLPAQKGTPHPLAPQLWILAICALIVTAIVCVYFLFTVVSLAALGEASEKAAEEFNRASEDLNRTLDKANKEMQRSLNKLDKP